MTKKYRKKPVVIEAVEWTGSDYCFDHVEALATNGPCTVGTRGGELYISTLEGEMHADQGDFIIKGVQGEVYPCKPDIFRDTYEEVVDE